MTSPGRGALHGDPVRQEGALTVERVALVYGTRRGDPELEDVGLLVAREGRRGHVGYEAGPRALHEVETGLPSAPRCHGVVEAPRQRHLVRRLG